MLSTMAKKSSTKRRSDASIPEWLQDAIADDKSALGQGPRFHGGLQAVTSAALLLYLAMPQQDRRDLARLATIGDDEQARKLTDEHWLIVACRAITSQGEGAARDYIHRQEEMKRAQEHARSERKEGPASPGRKRNGPKRAG